MRSRLRLMVVATTTMVTLAYLLPLGLLVRSVARDRALAAVERDAGALAPVLAVTTDPEAVSAAVSATASGRGRRLSVFLPDGRRVGGDEAVDAEGLQLAGRGSAFFADAPGGAALFLPVLGERGTSVVHVLVPEALMEQGVRRSWLVLAGLAIVLAVLPVLVADRLGRSVVHPVSDLADAADRLGKGDLASRVKPAGPPEIVAVGRAFNLLAGRIADLLEAERESVADLSHRLRTPLTVLRMQADALPAGDPRSRMREAAEELERVVTHVIEEARRPIRAGTGMAVDLGEVVRERAAFWRPLAEDQGRRWSVRLEEGPWPVAVGRSDLEAAIDALLGNVFTHTPEGASASVTIEATERGWARLVVEDGGPGLPADTPLGRGRSGAGSTGLGLDIARLTAERAGGRLRTGTAVLGGARIELEFPPSG